MTLTHIHTPRRIRIQKPFFCYLKDAVLWPKRFVSSFAGTLKLHSLRLGEKKKGLSLLTIFYCGSAKLISAVDTRVRISEIHDFGEGGKEPVRESKVCLQIGCASIFWCRTCGGGGK